MSNEEMTSNFSDTNSSYQKAKKLSIEVIKVCQNLMRQNDYTIIAPICNQIVRSATSVCANIAEGSIQFLSTKDRINKFLISLKELSETLSWLEILLGIEEITKEDYVYFCNEYTELKKILNKSIYTMKSKLNTVSK